MQSTNKSPLSRRNLIKFGAVTLGTSALTLGINKTRSGLPGSAANAAIVLDTAIASDIPADVSPDQALEFLKAGNQRFVAHKLNSPNLDSVRLREVAEGQKPFAAVLGCADSRVPVEIIFDRGLGDVFVVRGAGNIATPEEIGSLEFGTLVLGTKILVVLGHERCGAVQATIAGNAVPGQIGRILEAIKPAVESSKNQPGDQLYNATKANILLQIEKLKKSPVISQLIQEGKLKIVGGYYDLDTGKVDFFNAE